MLQGDFYERWELPPEWDDFLLDFMFVLRPAIAILDDKTPLDTQKYQK
jgi:hypothetical protein